MTVKRSVSMYSLQDAYARHRLDMPGVLKFVTDLGAGVELISDQMIKGAPRPTEETLKQWDDVVAETGATLVCNDIFINSTLYKNRVLRPDEQLELLQADLRLSHRLGFSLVRPVSDTDSRVLEAALPLAEELGVVMAMEVHAGMSYTTPFTKRFIELCERTQSEYLGLTVDLGIFCDRIPRVYSNYFRSLGASEDVIAYVEQAYLDNGDCTRAFGTGSGHGFSIPDQLKGKVRNGADRDFVMLCTGYENTPYEMFDKYLPITKHIHAKFYEMTDEGEYSIDYPKFVAHLKEVGYDHYMSSEYEGQRFVPLGESVDDLDQVRRHQEMLKSLIDGKEN